MTLAPTRPIWLSGAIQTAIHRFALPAILLGMVASFLVLVVRGVLPTEGIVATSSVGLFPLVVSAAVLWLPSHLYRVGHCGSELVIGNYRRKVSVPFDQIAAVEAVGAVKNLVRIRFHHATPFGATVYYLERSGFLLPKSWKTGDELRDLLARAGVTGFASGSLTYTPL